MLRSAYQITIIVLVACLVWRCDNVTSSGDRFFNAEQGAFPRLVENSEKGDRIIDLLDLDRFHYTYSVEFIDGKGGELISEYILEVRYVDNDGSNGVNSTDLSQLRSYTQSDFMMGSQFLKLTNIMITPTDLIEATGVDPELLRSGDVFEVVSTVILQNGTIYNGEKTSELLQGNTFNAFFDFVFKVFCPLDHNPTYPYYSTNIWCQNDTIRGNVDLVQVEDEVYYFSDFTFGTYNYCYGSGVLGEPYFFLIHRCGKISIEIRDGHPDQSIQASLVGVDLILDWENPQEYARSVITFPEGTSFTLAD